MLIVDRFEGDRVIIEFDEGFFELPRAMVSEEVKEGDVLRLEIDHDKTEKRRKRIKDLMDDLFE